MDRYLQITKDFLDLDDWKYDCDEEKQVIKSGVKSENGSYKILFVSREDKDQYLIYAIAPVEVPEKDRSKICEFFARANYGLMIGNFELDMNDGEMRYKVSVTLEDAGLTHGMVSSMLKYCISTMDKYYREIMNVIYGSISPEEAIRHVEDR